MRDRNRTLEVWGSIPHVSTRNSRVSQRCEALVVFGARDPGETAARCFELFDEGKADREIVIALRITPDMVTDLRIKWDFGGGFKRVISNEAWKALADLVGEFGDVTDLVERIAALKKAKDGEQR